MSEQSDEDFPSAPEFGRSLRGMGVNLLVSNVPQTVAFVTEVFDLEMVYVDSDFAVIAREGQQWMLHGDHTYHSHPLLALTGDGVVRGAGIELQLYGIDPDSAEAKARARGDAILQSAQNKPHGLREAVIVGPDGYVWVPSLPLREGADGQP
ncbi:MAG: glyoxalase [Pseudomonadota bacterium]